MGVYMMGTWAARAGHAEEFIQLWHERVESAQAEMNNRGWAMLLRDKENPNHFVSVAQYEDEAAFIRWRDGDGFKNRLADLRMVLDSADTSLFQVVESVGEAPLVP
jgi:heme-degrading monooxygenase HmoA